MVVVKVHYGLGNQLFQYALARSLSIQKGYDFALDISFFSGPPDAEHPRIYQLDKFNIRQNIAEPEQIASFLSPGIWKRRLRSVVQAGRPYYKRKVVYEGRLDFDADILQVRDDSYLFGYWQDERYFFPVQDTLRKELSFCSEPSGLNKEMLDLISGTEAVSLHIRRGDYLTDAFTVNNVGICDLDYYRRAIQLIAEKVQSPVFYVFSDDPEWTGANVKIDHPCVFVNHNSQENAFEDLRLMSRCKHHVIANSSFSWWGAWLSGNSEKVVIAPRIWRSKGPDMFVPGNWRKI